MDLEYNLWVARDEEGQLWFSMPLKGAAPRGKPVRATSINKIYRWIRARGYKVAQVGICDIDRIRHSEVRQTK
jgi:hypothetical protein